jgi:hypothetical protein
MIGECAASLERLGESAGDDMVDARPSPDYESVSVSRERAAQLFGQKTDRRRQARHPARSIRLTER